MAETDPYKKKRRKPAKKGFLENARKAVMKIVNNFGKGIQKAILGEKKKPPKKKNTNPY